MNYDYITWPFGNFIQGNCSSITIDAFYILSMENRPIPSVSLSLLAKQCKEIVFLFTEFIPKWYESVKERYGCVRCIQVKYHDYYLSYMGKPQNTNVSLKWRPDFDIPIKRSYALYESRKMQYRYIGMLDDDVFITEFHLNNALYALEKRCTLVGFHIDSYPDKSSLEHVERELTGKYAPISMTGSAMFIDIKHARGDFPLIYNEDVLFFLQQTDLSKVVSGGVIHQKDYYSWKSGGRIKHEQFGEIIFNAFKRELINGNKEKINWNNEINNAKEKVQQLIMLDQSHIYTSLLENAMVAISQITENDIVDFLRLNSFPPTINSLCEVSI